ncbi:uncharacterized protein si:ch211-14c7.2 [Sardina pilchardus]|uniref:uncharacterized protein si:ch211-14c7.2 n=1 Tax=Sardina pilchardus TaxID=27697 RepID=UPI002E0E0722
MLQQNNNNNYPCLDRAVLQDRGKSGVPFAGPLDFGDMSLIKTLRAWARSGLSAKARGGTAPLHHHLAKSCQPSSGSDQGAPGAALSIRPAASGSVRGAVGGGGQAGLGALVTVATLKASEGGRQTQTRCLLLKAEGRNYVCAVSGANRGGPTPPSRATLVGSWLRETVVGSRDATGAKSAAQSGQCDGEVFRVKPRPAKKWRKLSNSPAAIATNADTAQSEKDCDGSPHELEETQPQQQQQQQHGAKRNCVSARLNIHGRKARGSAQRGSGRTSDRRGAARTASKQDGSHDAVAQAKENVDIINVPRAEHCSRTVRADLKKTWTDCTTAGSESKGEANRVVTEPRCQISHLNESPDKEEKEISLHINSLGEAEEEATVSLDRTGNTACSVTETREMTKQRVEEPTEESLPSRWVSNLSPGRRCCTELGLEKQHCCCKDEDTGFTNSKDLPQPEPSDKTDQEELEALNRLALLDINPPYGCVCVERDSRGGDKVDGRVENGPKSNLLSESPQTETETETEREQAPQGLGEGGGGGGGGGGGEQQDLGIRSADNNPPWTAPTASNTARTGADPAVRAPSTAEITTTTTAATATATAATITHAPPNPAPPGAMATGLPGPRREKAEAEGGASEAREAEVSAAAEPQSEGQPREPSAPETHATTTVDTDGQSLGGGGGGGGGGRGGEWEGEEEEEDEFGGFMQAGEAPVWEDGFAEFHQVPCGKVEVSDKGNVSSWQSDWTASSFHQSDVSWAAFSQDQDSQGGVDEIASGQWWPQTVMEDEGDDLNAPRVFLEAFPPVPSTTFDLNGIPTLKQLLQGAAEQNRASEDYGETSLLEGFQDLNKMFGLKHKRTESPSWKRLLTSLQVDSRRSTHLKDLPQGHDLSTGHPVVSLQVPLTSKRRLSYDLNRNLLP